MKYKIDKNIRLVELFSGVGTQAMALRDIGAEFERYKTSEWEVNAIASYKAIHCENDNTDYSRGMTKEELPEELYRLGISNDGKEPMPLEKIEKKPEKWLRNTYNNIKATNNVVSIVNATAADLEIVDTDKYCYVVTYSFPCQDLSVAGKMRGMDRGSGTRSGLLWEVERILKECEELPQILIMENVKNVIGKKNMDIFNSWLSSLEGLGYSNYYQIMNAKDYGVPQNRERCFMVSILGKYDYEFPQKKKLEVRLKDILEENVDEKYYIDTEVTRKLIRKIGEEETQQFEEVQGIDKSYNEPKGIEIANCITAREDRGISNYKKCGTAVMVREATKKGYAEAYEGDSINMEQSNSKTRRGRVGKQVAQTLTTSPQQAVIEPKVTKEKRIRKLTPLECWRLMDFTDEDYYKAAKVNSDSQLYKQAGNAIVKACLMEIFKPLLGIQESREAAVQEETTEKDLKEERIKESEFENMKLKAMLFDYMQKERTE